MDTNVWEAVIGLEVHCQLLTKSKIFSGAATAYGAEPNTQADAVTLGLPGVLPVLNQQALRMAVKFGLSVGATVAERSVFARKHYFYPDLPKGYQISQYELPIVEKGYLDIELPGPKGGEPVVKRIGITRAHMEEDAGKSLHEDFHGLSGIDLNRAGTPLLEVVSEPDMRSPEEAVAYAKTLHTLVTWLGICDGNMQEGSFRCDANVSVRRPGEPFGTRREIKNLNSFRFLQQAIDYEVNWQIDQIEDGLEIQQATVLFNPDTGETRAMRTKEDAHDYRYFPDPDLPPLVIAPQWVDRVKAEMPELPGAMAARFVAQDGLPEYDAQMMTQSLATARYYEAAREASGQAKLAANWVMGEISKRLNAAGTEIDAAPVGPVVLGALIRRVQDGTISNNSARQVFDELWSKGEGSESGESVLDAPAAPAQDLTTATAAVDAIIEAKGLKQMNDSGALEAIVDEVIAANEKSVAEYRSGKDKAFNALVGQVMKASKGKANPAQAGELLKQKLG